MVYSTNPNSKLKNYCTVVLKGLDDLDEVPKDMDIVRSEWTYFDQGKNQFVVNFPSPPYTVKVRGGLENRLKNNLPGNTTWTFYEMNIRGKASKFFSTSET